MRFLEIIEAVWDREVLTIHLRMQDRRQFEQRRTVTDVETGAVVLDETLREEKVVASIGASFQYKPEDPKVVNTDPAKMAEWKARFDTDAKIKAAVLAHPEHAKCRAEMETRCAALAASANVKPPEPRKPIAL
jgi:hypothetical protein